MSNTVHVDELIDRQQLTGRNYFVLALLLIALVCDGFDLQLVGVAAPWLTEAWGVKPSELVGPVQSANLFGMMLGAIFLGGLGDRIGRKRIIVGGTFLFGAMTLACTADLDRDAAGHRALPHRHRPRWRAAERHRAHGRDNAAAQARNDDQLRHHRHVAGQRAAGRGRREARADVRLGIAVHRRRHRADRDRSPAGHLPAGVAAVPDEPRPRPRAARASRAGARPAAEDHGRHHLRAARSRARLARSSFRDLFRRGCASRRRCCGSCSPACCCRCTSSTAGSRPC